MPEVPLLTDDEARRVLREVDRLWRLLPPTSQHRRRPASYTALEAEIRSYADQYRAYEAAREIGEKCRMAKAGLRSGTHDDDTSFTRRGQGR